MAAAAPEIPGLKLLQGPGPDGRGNWIYLREDGAGSRVLKLYRRRSSRVQERSEALFSWVAGTTARTASARYRTERDGLDLWAREGFDVFRRCDEPLPAGAAPPGIWLEYCPGTLLLDVLRDPETQFEEKLALLTRLGRVLGERHARAVEACEPRLAQKHGTTEHILLWRDRMITVDLEGSFRPGFPVLEALVQELAGYLRSVAKHTAPRHDEAFTALVRGYPSPELLRKIAHWAVEGRSLYRRLARRQDRQKRSEHSKTEVMERILRLVRP